MGYYFPNIITLGKEYNKTEFSFNFENFDSILTDIERSNYEVLFSTTEYRLEIALSKPYFPQEYYETASRVLNRIKNKKETDKWYMVQSVIGPPEPPLPKDEFYPVVDTYKK